MCKKAQDNEKKKRPPLKPRVGPYTKVNAYTLKPSFQQLITLFLSLLVVVLHSIFNVNAIIKINEPILFVLLGLNYLLIALLIFFYIKITIKDPADRNILIQNSLQNQVNLSDKHQLKYCTLCLAYVRQKSYHCKRCNRCTQDFDHHCVFLNSCIGSLNYELFLVLLLFYVLFLINTIGQSVWVFVRALNNDNVREASITEWMSIVIIGICFLQIVATVALLTFHCYISCCLDLTTLAFYQSSTESQRKSQIVQIQKIEPKQSPAGLLQNKQLQNSQDNIN